jgi:hypothetical protein
LNISAKTKTQKPVKCQTATASSSLQNPTANVKNVTGPIAKNAWSLPTRGNARPKTKKN